jgi:hypothetical protein
MRSKAQFIHRHGAPVTVTRLDGTSFDTRALYHQLMRTSQFSEGSTFSFNYLREGVFTPDTDIQDGYLVDVPSVNERCIVIARNNDLGFGHNWSNAVQMLVINYPNVELRRLVTTYDNWGHPTGHSWNLIGTYPAAVDYRNGGLTYNNALMLENEQMILIMQKTVPLQLKPDADRLVVNGVNYQVDALDYDTSIGVVFVRVELDKRS